MKKKEIRSKLLNTVDSIDNIVDRLKFLSSAFHRGEHEEYGFTGYEISSTVRAIADDLNTINKRLHVAV